MPFVQNLLSLSAMTVFTGLLLGCENGQAPPPRYPAPPPAVPGAPIVYYRFPFQGKWRVHRTHYGTRQEDQAFALDLVPEGQTGDKTKNEGYPCYNVPVLADAPGIVVIAVDGVPDNIPGQKNGYDAHGNYVVIDHQNGEFSLMAHLIPGSLKVRPGTPVQAGMELGRCGNTGMSTMPHIHWQVMDNPNAANARGIPPRFTTYSRNGNPSVDRPEAKDTVENK
ncbi:MAG: M23 family metallopeptidase [Polyangiaceae bacterium]|nr:M23 family metallopeptidase [Polyangiaceae bacterium]